MNSTTVRLSCNGPSTRSRIQGQEVLIMMMMNMKKNNNTCCQQRLSGWATFGEIQCLGYHRAVLLTKHSTLSSCSLLSHTAVSVSTQSPSIAFDASHTIDE